MDDRHGSLERARWFILTPASSHQKSMMHPSMSPPHPPPRTIEASIYTLHQRPAGHSQQPASDAAAGTWPAPKGLRIGWRRPGLGSAQRPHDWGEIRRSRACSFASLGCDSFPMCDGFSVLVFGFGADGISATGMEQGVPKWTTW